jgi:hypothetical protein
MNLIENNSQTITKFFGKSNKLIIQKATTRNNRRLEKNVRPIQPFLHNRNEISEEYGFRLWI